MSRWRVLVGVLCGFGFACALALHFATRDRMEASGAPGSEAPAGRVVEPLAGATQVATPAPEPPVTVAPLFDTSRRFKPGETAVLEFQALHTGTGEPVSGAALSVSVLHMPERKEERLPVREKGDGRYEAEFTPLAPGQFQLAVSSGGAPARTTAPVNLGVVGTAGGDAQDEALLEPARGHARIATGGSRQRR